MYGLVVGALLALIFSDGRVTSVEARHAAGSRHLRIGQQYVGAGRHLHDTGGSYEEDCKLKCYGVKSDFKVCDLRTLTEYDNDCIPKCEGTWEYTIHAPCQELPCDPACETYEDGPQPYVCDMETKTQYPNSCLAECVGSEFGHMEEPPITVPGPCPE